MFDVLMVGLIELHVLSHPELSLTRLEDISLLCYSSALKLVFGTCLTPPPHPPPPPKKKKQLLKRIIIMKYEMVHSTCMCKLDFCKT